MTKKQKKPVTLVLGLTGSIGVGKSTAAKKLEKLGLPVFHADATVHKLLTKGGKAFSLVAATFPQAVHNGRIDRDRLGNTVFSSPKKLRRLEKIIHPFVMGETERFIRNARRKNKRLVVLDVPLLFETKADRLCDFTLCLTATRAEQKKRVLMRQGMTLARFHAILRQQMPDREKRQRADIVINTAQNPQSTGRKLKQLVCNLLQHKG